MTEPDRAPASTAAPDVPQLDLDPDGDFTTLLARMGAVLLATETITTTVETVTRLAAELLPGTTGSGVSLIDTEGRRTIASSNPLVDQADALQYQLGSGPCLTAWHDQVTIRIDDLTVEDRWPQWTQAAATDLSIRSMLSAPLLTADAAAGAIGAIKVYADQPDVYDQLAEHVLELFAAQAAALLANMQTLTDARHLSANLQAALASRDVIGQAKGILIAQGAADADTAFAILATASQRSNRKLRDVASDVITAVQQRQPRSTN